MATYEKSFLLSLYRDMVRIRAFEEHAAECFTTVSYTHLTLPTTSRV